MLTTLNFNCYKLCEFIAIWPVKQPDGLVNGNPPAAFFRLAISLVSSIHVFLWEVTAQEIKVGRVNSDQPRIQHVLHLQMEEAEYTGA